MYKNKINKKLISEGLENLKVGWDACSYASTGSKQETAQEPTMKEFYKDLLGSAKILGKISKTICGEMVTEVRERYKNVFQKK